jgi:PAT family beta-lactamase induction signal transducer AmpG
LTGTSAGALIERFGYVDFYLLTTVLALPGIILFWLMMRSGLVDSSIGTAGVVGEGDARAGDQSGSVPLSDSASPAR